MRSFMCGASADPLHSLRSFNKLNVKAPGQNKQRSSSEQLTLSSVTVRHSQTARKYSTSSSSSSAKYSVFSLFSRMPIPSTSKRINRLKSSSSSSTTNQSTASLTHDTPELTLEQRTEAVRAAKAVLRTVRTDWKYPQPGRPRPKNRVHSAGNAARTGVSVRDVQKISDGIDSHLSQSPGSKTSEEEPVQNESDATDILNYKPKTSNVYHHINEDNDEEEDDDDDDDDFMEDQAEWRYREESDTEGEVENTKPRSNGAAAYAEDSKSPYRFDNPDFVGRPLSLDERKTQRQVALKEEMEWNEGVKCFVERRDAWAGTNSKGKIKVCQSKFIDNPIRRYIRPEQYPQIYSRVVVRGADPHVPINLKDVTSAMVQGWKAEDQWPPKAIAPEPSFAKKRGPGGTIGGGGNGHNHSSVGDSVMKRVFGSFGGR